MVAAPKRGKEPKPQTAYGPGEVFPKLFSNSAERKVTIRRPLPDHLPRETVVHEPALVCGCGDRSRLARLGEDTTEVLEKIPARLKVIRHVRPCYACRICEAIFQTPRGLSGLRLRPARPWALRFYA